MFIRSVYLQQRDKRDIVHLAPSFFSSVALKFHPFGRLTTLEMEKKRKQKSGIYAKRKSKTKERTKDKMLS